MFKSTDDLRAYVQENYPEVTDNRINDDHWDLQCTHCKMTRGFQVVRRDVQGTRSIYRENEFSVDHYAPITYLFCCPVCKAFKQWVMYRIGLPNDTDGRIQTHYFRVTSVPSEGLEETDELPTNPSSLRDAYRQAIRAMDANAHLAAAAMFRRTLQVITRDLLGAKPGNLANELNEVVGKTYNGGLHGLLKKVSPSTTVRPAKVAFLVNLPIHVIGYRDNELGIARENRLCAAVR
jgi:Domain of unknown function (DUF4145)